MQCKRSLLFSDHTDNDSDEDFEIDWVVLYDFGDIELHQAIDKYETLIRDIEASGLETEVRRGHGTALLVLIRVPRNQLGNEVYRSRVKDWLFGIVHSRPLGDSATIVDADTPSEEMRSVFHLVTWTKEQGGAGITANFGQWENVTASFSPHAWIANTELLRKLAAKTVLGVEDLDQIKALFGEKAVQYLPTILLAVSLPYITGTWTSIAARLSEHENHRTNDEFELAQVRKAFVLNFITSFLPIILTAYVYVPYGPKLLPHLILDSWQSHISAKDFRVDAHRLQEEVISLSMAGQVINFGEEFVLPYVKRQLMEAYRKYKDGQEVTTLHQRMHSEYTKALLVDAPQEQSLLARLRAEATTPPYDVQEDTMEMCNQFGYLTMFGVAYPLMPLDFLINNWIELRGDFFKLINECQRPPPIRSDTIGPLVSALEFLTWLGTLSTAALFHMHSGDISQVRLSRLLLTVFLAEQAYLATKLTIHFIFDQIGSEAVRQEEAIRRLMRKRYLETFSEEVAGTFLRQASHTYLGSRRSAPSTSTQTQQALYSVPEVVEVDCVRSEYKCEKGERFWNQRKEVTGTREAGMKLIVTLKGMQKSSETSGGNDKRKWIWRISMQTERDRHVMRRGSYRHLCNFILGFE
ncbi:putative plasma membrane stress response protein [Aureobasidium subglaciale]|nr:putative plasma membrane stress response protein [Aureobasidium subglaciale]